MNTVIIVIGLVILALAVPKYETFFRTRRADILTYLFHNETGVRLAVVTVGLGVLAIGLFASL